MPSQTLRLVHSSEPAAVPDAAVIPGPRPAPEAIAAADGPFRASALASFGVHAAILAGMIVGGIVLGEEQSAGSGADVVLIESVPVEFIDAAPTPEAPPVEAVEAEPPADTEEAAPDEAAEPKAEPETKTAELVEEPVETVEQQPEPPPEPPIEEPPPEIAPTTVPLPQPDAPTGELPAQAEEDATPLDAETVPTPRARPEPTEVAEARPPPEPQKPEPPAAPPPSAPSAPAATSTKSGGAGAGGASPTAGSSAASAYRAKVAAQLKRKRFYPNAARRDRLTGTATVSFTLNASGRVTTVKVVRTSGARVLDEAAKEMVQRAAPYPPIPADLGATITIQAPIAFDLPR